MTLRPNLTDEARQLIEHEPAQFIQRAAELGLTHAEATTVLIQHWEEILAASGFDERRLHLRERVVQKNRTRYIYIESDRKCLSFDEMTPALRSLILGAL